MTFAQKCSIIRGMENEKKYKNKEWLEEQVVRLKKRDKQIAGDFGISTSYHKSNNTICVSVSETPSFLSYMEECSEEINVCYGYKFQLNRIKREWIAEVRPKLEQKICGGEV